MHGVIGVDHGLTCRVLNADKHARAVIFESRFVVVMIPDKRDLRLGGAAPAAHALRVFELGQLVHRVQYGYRNYPRVFKNLYGDPEIQTAVSPELTSGIPVTPSPSIFAYLPNRTEYRSPYI